MLPNPESEAAARAGRLIAASTVWEGSVGWSTECLPYTDGILDRYRRAGFSHVSLTVAAEWNSLDFTMHYLARTRRWFAERPADFILVETIDDVMAARAAGKLAVSFNFQGGGPLGGDPLMIEAYARLGVKLAILTYNMRNSLGDGCQEPGDAGLSLLGRRFVEEMNRAGMVIDLSHVGQRTALDTIEHSRHPVVFSHSNPAGVYAHVRNISRDMIVACAAKGGLIGLNSLMFMLSEKRRATVEDFVRHVRFVADLVGPAHVGLGMDWNFYDAFMQKMFTENPMMAKLGYPPPPWDSLAPETLPEVIEQLLEAGWSDAEVRGLLGENMLRVARQVWRRH